jgi:hypothetical protein
MRSLTRAVTTSFGVTSGWIYCTWHSQLTMLAVSTDEMSMTRELRRVAQSLQYEGIGYWTPIVLVGRVCFVCLFENRSLTSAAYRHCVRCVYACEPQHVRSTLSVPLVCTLHQVDLATPVRWRATKKAPVREEPGTGSSLVRGAFGCCLKQRSVLAK